MKNKEGIKGMWIPDEEAKNIIFSTIGSEPHIQVNKNLMHSIGLLETLLLSNLIDKYKYFEAKGKIEKDEDGNGWFFNTSENIEWDTTLSWKQQHRVIKNLKEKQLIECKLMGLPARLYFCIQFKNVLSQVSAKRRNLAPLKGDSPIKKNKERRTNSSSKEEDCTTGKPLCSNSSKNKIVKREKPLPPDPPLAPIHCPKLIKEFIDYWHSKPLAKHADNTKTYKNIINDIRELVRADFYSSFPVEHKFQNRKFTLAEFKIAVDRFVIMVTDKTVYPLNKKFIKYMGISKFLYCRWSPINKSHFLLCLEKEPVKIPIDPNPELTDMLVLRYKETTSMSFQPSSAQMDKFIMASNRLSNFFEKNKHRLNGGITHKVWNEKNKVDLLLNAVYADTNGQPISPGWLCSNDTFDRRLPAYFEDHRY